MRHVLAHDYETHRRTQALSNRQPLYFRGLSWMLVGITETNWGRVVRVGLVAFAALVVALGLTAPRWIGFLK